MQLYFSLPFFYLCRGSVDFYTVWSWISKNIDYAKQVHRVSFRILDITQCVNSELMQRNMGVLMTFALFLLENPLNTPLS